VPNHRSWLTRTLPSRVIDAVADPIGSHDIGSHDIGGHHIDRHLTDIGPGIILPFGHCRGSSAGGTDLTPDPRESADVTRAELLPEQLPADRSAVFRPDRDPAATATLPVQSRTRGWGAAASLGGETDVACPILNRIRAHGANRETGIAPFWMTPL
jgi:hypothetical protein